MKLNSEVVIIPNFLTQKSDLGGEFQWILGTPEFQLLTSKDPIQTPHMTEDCREGDVSETFLEWESRGLTWKINPDMSLIFGFLFVSWPGTTGAFNESLR